MNGPGKKTWAILVTICLTVVDAQACGELMLRSLGGMRYHAFVTRHPAEILLYSRDATSDSKRPAASDAKFHDSLEKVGHKVTMARGPDELGQALAAHHYDVIVGYAEDMLAATSQIAKAPREPTLIPVLDTASNERQMRERFPLLVTGSFKDLLRTIENAMKAPRA
jgi:hypothetical protein